MSYLYRKGEGQKARGNRFSRKGAPLVKRQRNFVARSARWWCHVMKPRLYPLYFLLVSPSSPSPSSPSAVTIREEELGRTIVQPFVSFWYSRARWRARLVRCCGEIRWWHRARDVYKFFGIFSYILYLFMLRLLCHVAMPFEKFNFLVAREPRGVWFNTLW